MAAYDLVVIGGGIVGVATALRASEIYPGISIAILEKEEALARHQTGRNSGVIHAGVYYAPGSLKAVFCKAGVNDTIRFCQDHDIPFERCGKLIVATQPEDMPRMMALHQRSKDNNLPLELINATELKRREPHITGLGALYSPTTSIVDFGLVTRTMASLAASRGVEIVTGSEVHAIWEDGTGVTVETGRLTIRTGNLIACAGINADRIAGLCGLSLDFRMIPVRGEYYRLTLDKNDIVRHLIYPVPDPALPFLGVHLTRMIGGYVTIGPNAVLAFAREGYRFFDVNIRDVTEMVGYSGFRKFAKQHFRMGLQEMANSLSKRRYLALCQRYCPELQVKDLEPYRPGVRAQAVMADGSLHHDFLIRSTRRTIHVCNAPSPAATSALPIARHILDQAATQFSLPSPKRAVRDGAS
jgi:L-2-hydroxyglutarate oxidase